MPDKTLPLILAVLGALAVLAVALFADVQRAARHGPRWKRRVLTGGLALLAALGIGPGAAYASSADGTRLVAAKRSLAATPEWKRIQAVWTEAAEVAGGKRGSFPFDRAGKDELLADLDAARKAVEDLRTQGHLSGEESGLLISDIDRFKEKVQRFRPTELKQATCYKPVMYREGQDTLTWFEGRLPLLEKMAAGAVKPVVAKKVLDRFEQDVTFLSDETKIRDLSPEQRKQVEQLVVRARRAMSRARQAFEPKHPPPPPTCYKPMPQPDKRGMAPDTKQRRQAAAKRIIAAQRLAPTAAAKVARLHEQREPEDR